MGGRHYDAGTQTTNRAARALLSVVCMDYFPKGMEMAAEIVARAYG